MKKEGMKESLNESGLTKIWQYMENYDTGIITGYRWGESCGGCRKYTREENRKRNKLLLSKLFNMGYTVVGINGNYKENWKSKDPENPERVVGEKSFFVVDTKKKGELLKDLIRLGIEFEQDSIMFIPIGGQSAEMHGTNKCSNAFPGWKIKSVLPDRMIGQDGDFFSSVKNRPWRFYNKIEEIAEPRGFFGKLGMSVFSKKTVNEIMENK